METFSHVIPKVVNDIEKFPHIIPKTVNMETFSHITPKVANNLRTFLLVSEKVVNEMETAQQMHVYQTNKLLFTKLETRLLQMKLIDRTDT